MHIIRRTMTTFEQLKQVLIETRQIPANQIVETATFDQLGLDSLDAVDLLMTLEEKLGKKVNVQDNIKTLADVVTLIDQSR